MSFDRLLAGAVVEVPVRTQDDDASLNFVFGVEGAMDCDYGPDGGAGLRDRKMVGVPNVN
jgi:hypothetical protein